MPPERRFTLGERDVCLVGEKATSVVPAMNGCESLRSCDYGHA